MASSDILIHNVPTRVKSMFKAACARAGVSMRASVIGHMKNAAALDRKIKAANLKTARMMKKAGM